MMNYPIPTVALILADPAGEIWFRKPKLEIPSKEFVEGTSWEATLKALLQELVPEATALRPWLIGLYNQGQLSTVAFGVEVDVNHVRPVGQWAGHRELPALVQKGGLRAEFAEMAKDFWGGNRISVEFHQ